MPLPFLALALLFTLVHAQNSSLYTPVTFAASAILSDGAFYLYGGATRIAALNVGSKQFLRLDLTQSFNTTAPPWTALPGYLSYTMITAAPSRDGKQLILGGNRDNFGPISYIYDVGDAEWTRAPDLPGLVGSMDQYKRSNLGITLDPYTGLVYMYGGFQYYGFSSEISVMDTNNPSPSKMTWTLAQNQTQIPALYEPVVLFLPTLKKTAVLGGCSGFNASSGLVESCARLDVVYLISNGISISALDIQRQVTGATGTTPTPRYHVCKVVLKNGNVFIQGGKNQNTFFNEAWILDVSNWTWNTVTINGPVEAMTRNGHTCQMGPNGQILVVGGVDSSNAFVTPYMAVIDTNTWTWTTQYKGAPLNSIWTNYPKPGGDGNNNGGPGSGAGNTSDGLSSGAKGGIGAGIAIGVLALCVGFFFWRRKRQQQQASDQSGNHALPPTPETSHTASTSNSNERDTNRLTHGSSSDTGHSPPPGSGSGSGTETASHQFVPVPLPQAQMAPSQLPSQQMSQMGPVHMVPAHMLPHFIPAYQLAGPMSQHAMMPIPQHSMVPVSQPITPGSHPALVPVSLASIPQHSMSPLAHQSLSPVSHQPLGSIPLSSIVYQGQTPNPQQVYATGLQGGSTVQDTVLSDSTLGNPLSTSGLTTLPVQSGQAVNGRNSVSPTLPDPTTSNPSIQRSKSSAEDAALAAALFQAEDLTSRRFPSQPDFTASSSSASSQGTTLSQPWHQVYATRTPSAIHPSNYSNEGTTIPEARPAGVAPSPPSSLSSSATSSPLSSRPSMAVSNDESTSSTITTAHRPVISLASLPGPQSVPEHEAQIERFAPGIKSHVLSTRDLDQDGFYPPLTPKGTYNSHSIVVGVPAAGGTSNASSFSAAASSCLTRPSPNRDMESAAITSAGYFPPTLCDSTTYKNSTATSPPGQEYRHQDGLSSTPSSQSQPYRDPQMMKDLESISKLIELQTQSELKSPHAVVTPP
ncbi:hypothetical protein BGX34_000922 [Mortierella sp. NVP85]|nr:hypothetical protein BGX34_000922 [Mortierella sp. NVP85]